MTASQLVGIMGAGDPGSVAEQLADGSWLVVGGDGARVVVPSDEQTAEIERAAKERSAELVARFNDGVVRDDRSASLSALFVG